MPTGTVRANLFLERFGDARHRSAGEPAWLGELRESALKHFLTLGVPTARDEEYKYTDLSRLASGRLLLAARANGRPARPPGFVQETGTAMEFGTGQAPGGRCSDGVRVLSLQAALHDEPELLAAHLAQVAPAPRSHALCALNTAFFEDAAVVIVEPGAVADRPVHLAFGDGPEGRHPRVLIIAGQSSSVQVIESYWGAGAYWRNAVTEISAGPNARVHHCRAQFESDEAVHTGLVQGLQQRDSFVSSFSLSFGARIARNDIGTRLDATGCECSLDGLFAVRDRQHVDHHTAIDHAQPHCHSHQVYKGVLDGHSRGVFNGKIFVRRDAQKTDAVQSNKNLLLSDTAEVNTKPQLEIDANDVRCTHGATIGQLDAEAAFYLRSRGIGRRQARALLTYAFAADALDRVHPEGLREPFRRLLLRRFAGESG